MTEEIGSEVHRYLTINSNLSIIKKENHLSLKTIKTKTEHFFTWLWLGDSEEDGPTGTLIQKRKKRKKKPSLIRETDI